MRLFNIYSILFVFVKEKKFVSYCVHDQNCLLQNTKSINLYSLNNKLKQYALFLVKLISC